jgi:hypothetical protein
LFGLHSFSFKSQERARVHHRGLNSGDFTSDFTAAEPSSCDHTIGGGDHNDRTVNADVIESLEGGDFACKDVVTCLLAIAARDAQSAANDVSQ